MKVSLKLSVFVIMLLVTLSCSKKKDRIQPNVRSLTESVYSSVTIQPDSSYQAYAIVSGILDKNFVEEGDLINNGEAIAQITNNTPKLNTQNAKLALDLARKNYNGSAAILKSIDDDISAANLKLQNDSINFHRQQNLWSQNIGSKVDYDAKKLNYELSRNNLTSLKSKYDRTKNELETSVKQAQNNYQSTLINTKDFTIKSKIKGKVYAVYKEPGEIVNNMEPVASIGSADTFIIEMLVDEVDIVKINLEQEVLITLDAYEGIIFNASVSKILPKKDERNQTFKVEALFTESPKVLYPGLSGESNIIISKKDNVITIPKNYIINNNQVETDNGLETIVIGLENMEFVEVISGITKDTFIYKPE